MFVIPHLFEMPIFLTVIVPHYFKIQRYATVVIPHLFVLWKTRFQDKHVVNKTIQISRTIVTPLFSNFVRQAFRINILSTKQLKPLDLLIGSARAVRSLFST